MQFKSLIVFCTFLFSVATPVLGQPPQQGTAWWGADHPGQEDPKDPVHNDWHCDRYGNWHNDERDLNGHADSRCQTW